MAPSCTILHLNGYKIAGPTVLARLPHDELESLFRGYGYEPYFVEGDESEKVHQLLAGTLDTYRWQNQNPSKLTRARTVSKSVPCGR